MRDIPVLPNEAAATYLEGAVVLHRLARLVNSCLVHKIMTPKYFRSSPFVIDLFEAAVRAILVRCIIVVNWFGGNSMRK